MNPLFKIFLGANVKLFRATGGKISSSMFGGRVLLLTTRGNKSGKDRTVPLMFFYDGPNRIVIGSAGGSPGHPAWYKNLSRHPIVTVEVKGRRYEARAETLAGSDRSRIWNKVVTEQPRFAEYEQKAKGREIPVVVLNERDEDTRPC